MKTTAPVQRYLRSAWFYQKQIEVIDEKIMILRSKATKVTTSYQDAPTFGGFEDHRQKIIADMVDLERDYKRTVQQYKNKVQEVTFVINMLDDYQERMVLNLRYIHFENWQDIAYRLNYHESMVYKIHGRALMKLLEADNRIVKNGAMSIFSEKRKTIESLKAQIAMLQEKLKEIQNDKTG